MAHVPMSVSIQKVVITVNALLDTSFNLTNIAVKVNKHLWLHYIIAMWLTMYYYECTM